MYRLKPENRRPDLDRPPLTISGQGPDVDIPAQVAFEVPDSDPNGNGNNTIIRLSLDTARRMKLLPNEPRLEPVDIGAFAANHIRNWNSDLEE